MHTTTPPKRLLVLSLLSAGIGLAGGGAAYVLIRLIALLTNLALFHRAGWTLPSMKDLHAGPWLFVAAAGGGLLISALARWAPMIRGHGIPEAMEAVLTKQSRITPRAAIAKPLSAAIAIGTGGPFGAEGPIIVTGGALGSLAGQLFHVSASERKILLASGAAAGMAATFGAPLASVMLAIEVLLFEFSTRAFVPLVVASTVAAGVHSAFFGTGPLFAVPTHRFAGLSRLPFYLCLGLAAGLLAVVVVRGLVLCEDAFRRLPVPAFWHPAIGGAAFATVGVFVPRALGVGYDSIGGVLAGRFTITMLAVLLFAKLIAWWVALASGTSGGTLAPILLIGGSFGALFAHLVGRVFPGAGIAPGAMALVAMAAVFGAATRATFTSIVFAFELTRDYRAILPLMLATVVADLVASVFLKESLLTEKLARRGLHVHSDYSADTLRMTSVSEVMTADTETIFARDVATVSPRDPVSLALQRLLEENVEHLPVLDDGRLVGVCSRGDVLRAWERQLEHERREPGWLQRPRRRP